MKKLNRLEDYATIDAYCNKVPVYSLGYTYVYGVSPNLLPSTVLQDGNQNRRIKIQPKKSWEIRENKIGSTPCGQPKTAVNDGQPMRAVHLIDCNPETCWCSRGQTQPDVEDAWIRIDLPKESQIKSVVLVPHPRGLPENYESELNRVKFGQAFPRQLTIKMSRDAWHWETVYENKNFAQPKEMVPQEFTFFTRIAKQIWIIGRELPQVLDFGHCFSIAEVEVRDEKNNNVASISSGAAVTVSSTNYGECMDRFAQDMLWPIQYDLGFKWTRVGYDKGDFLWSHIERKKGVLQVDSRADAAITEAVLKGVNVIMCLDKGNWLYTKQKSRLLSKYFGWIGPYGSPPESLESEEHLRGYLNYVRYMVRHFKDRVKYFEIWNEWGSIEDPPSEAARQYCKFFKSAVEVIREEYPEAKILHASTYPEHTPEFIYTLLDEVGPIFDVVAFHPWYQADPASRKFREYPEWIRKMKSECEARGFRGKYMATEWTWSAPYPVPLPYYAFIPTSQTVTEMQKAKYAARLTLIHLALDVYSFWNELFQQQLVQRSIGLLRNTFSADPLSPTQPEPIYYVMRTISTIMDEANPIDVKIQFSPNDEKLEWYAFKKPSHLMIAAWIKGYALDDDSQEMKTDIAIPNLKLDQVTAIDVFNGEIQSLNVIYDKKTTIIKGMHIKDWPVIIVGKITT